MNVGENEVQDFLTKSHRTVLATIRGNGMAQLTNVASAYLDGKLEISTQGPSAKVKNIRRDSRVTLTILDDQNWYRYVVVYGTAEIVDYPEAEGELRRIYQTIAGDHPHWDEFDRAMKEEHRVVLRVSIDQVVN